MKAYAGITVSYYDQAPETSYAEIGRLMTNVKAHPQPEEKL